MVSDTATQPSNQQGEIVDVWSRTSRRYRRRAGLMLVLLALLFAGLCCFTFWLRTGVFWPFQSEHYSSLMSLSFQPTGSEQITLSDFLSAPIDVREVPVHGIIMGLLFASLSSIPILVAILYRFPFALVFAAMVMFLAAMPWLGITLLGGCALASLKPLRFSFRYASALVGLIPVAIYFVTASWEPSSAQSVFFRPLAMIYAPWVLALLGSCVICALALSTANLIGYRPGGIPPLLAMLFAIPVFLFYSQVGRDELEYRLLDQEIGPGSRLVFVPYDVGARADQAATRRWSDAREESYDQIQRRMLLRETRRVLERTEDDRTRAVAHCNAFIQRFPKSRYVPNVYFLKGRAQDMRIQRRKLIDDHRAEFRAEFPGRSSRRTWETLVEHFPDSELSAVALRKLAILKARDGDLDEAIAHLNTLLGRFDAMLAASHAPVPSEQSSDTLGLPRKRPSTGLGVDLRVEVAQARWLKELLEACRDDPPRPMAEVFGPHQRDADSTVRPISLLLSFDSGDPHYKDNLEALAKAFPGSQAAGYVEVQLALLERAISRRLQRFTAVTESLDGRGAQAKAMYYLADTLQEDTRFNDARLEFEKLIKEHPESCWAIEAEARLSSLSLQETRTPEE